MTELFDPACHPIGQQTAEAPAASRTASPGLRPLLLNPEEPTPIPQRPKSLQPLGPLPTPTPRPTPPFPRPPGVLLPGS